MIKCPSPQPSPRVLGEGAGSVLRQQTLNEYQNEFGFAKIEAASSTSRNSRGSGKNTFSFAVETVSTETVKRAAKASIISSTRISGAAGIYMVMNRAITTAFYTTTPVWHGEHNGW